jgi:enoyl-CoA hydratase/carnithine racemase
VAVLTLNRPTNKNALSLELCAEVVDAVHAADIDPDVRVLVVTGTGGRAFSAGYDLGDQADGGLRSIEEYSARLNHDLRFTYSVWRCSKPVIAMISGYCLAGGLEFSQMCDIRYASDDSRFGVVETRFSDGVATLAMPWIIGTRCRELIYTGDMIDADEALRLGLVNKVFPKADLETEVMRIAKRMSRVAMPTLTWNKRAINNTYETMGFGPALAYGVEACAIMDSSPDEFAHFNELRRTAGVKEAIKWRDAIFAPFESETSWKS